MPVQEPNGEAMHKPLLSVVEQVARLKSQGVSFVHYSEREAADYLAHANNYLRTRSYRVLFPRRTEGARAGSYIGLDFAALVALASIDRQLRAALLGICIDIEHFAKIELLARCEQHQEDGYSLVRNYRAEIPSSELQRMEATFRRRGTAGRGRDEYSADLINHYTKPGTELPIWVLLEVVDFGRFADIWRFCALRWHDAEMRELHYVLKSVKSLRNACAHNSEIVNGFSKKTRMQYPTISSLILDSMETRGLVKSRVRRIKLRNPRIYQIARTFYSSSSLCTRPSTARRHARAMQEVRLTVDKYSWLFPADGSLTSYFDFIFKMVDIWLTPRVQYKQIQKPSGFARACPSNRMRSSFISGQLKGYLAPLSAPPDASETQRLPATIHTANHSPVPKIPRLVPRKLWYINGAGGEIQGLQKGGVFTSLLAG